MARVKAVLIAHGLEDTIVEFSASTRTSAEAAAAIGCTIAQIAKSLVFASEETDRPILVIASGANRVDQQKLATALGERVRKPDALWVRDKTGFAIGGVAPVGHITSPSIFIDEDLLNLDPIWAAAGQPNAVFRLTTKDLIRITNGQVLNLKP
ncbi:MAG: YbaK/EbsC family protein [Alphaproteobacteria bacterium]